MATITTKPCSLCKKTSVIEVTDAELFALHSGAHVQTALPERDADFRELVISGTHPECWDSMFGSMDEDD